MPVQIGRTLDPGVRVSGDSCKRNDQMQQSAGLCAFCALDLKHRFSLSKLAFEIACSSSLRVRKGRQAGLFLPRRLEWLRYPCDHA
jgi:hypothetical protein